MPPEGGNEPAEVPPPPRHLAEPALPRHVLVALAAIIADVTSVRQRQVDDPAGPDAQFRASMDGILHKLDDLVDSIYNRAAGGGVKR